MMDLTPHLNQEGGLKFLSVDFNAYLRAQNFAGLDKLIRSYLAANPSPIVKMCLSVPFGSVHCDPKEWDKLHRLIAGSGQDPASVAAIGFDLTGHWEGAGPGCEINIYPNEVDRGFLFSGKTHTQVLQQAQGTPPWQGFFTDIDSFGPFVGLETVYQALHDFILRTSYPKDKGSSNAVATSAESVGHFLGIWFIHLHVQESILRGLKQYGLPRAIPVLLGTHDFIGPVEVHNVIISNVISRNTHDFESIKAERIKKACDAERSRTKKSIEHVTMSWRYVQALRRKRPDFFSKTDMHFDEKSVCYTLRVFDIVPVKRISLMNEREFKALMEKYYKARMARFT